MKLFEFALEMERKTVQNYRDLARQCVAHEGIKNILSMLAKDHERHVQSLKEMKDKECSGMEATSVFKETKKLFESMQAKGEPFSCDMDQLKLYEEARDLVLKKKEFYLEMIGSVECESDKTLLKKMAEEEDKQAFVLANIIEMVNRPNTWIEDAEFNHLDDY